MSSSALPLAGLRVLDFSHAAAAPFATMFLADMGAEVIKIEKPKGGDGTRTMGVPIPALGPKQTDYYVSLNRNKRSIVLDLGTNEGCALARRMVERCDIVCENFRPGVMDRLGLGFETLRKLRPGLVYASISAFGPDGPWADRPANDIILQSVSGLMGITGEVGGGPVRIGAPIADFSSGLFMLSGVLAALHARERHPEGQHVQVAMLEAAFNMMANYIPGVATLGQVVPRVGRGHAQIVPYQAFACADGKYVMVGAFTRGFWENLCRALDREHWITDARFSSNPQRLANRELLVGELQVIFNGRPSAEWIEILSGADVPTSPVMELHEAIRSEQAQHNASLRTLGEGAGQYEVARSPIRVQAWGEREADAAPRMGDQTQAVLQEVLGLSEQAVAELAARGVVRLARAPEKAVA
jgi:crotonobetainyl-CoA:carnitine CoA-transferase CaiB-like acyl-CoA transferase